MNENIAGQDHFARYLGMEIIETGNYSAGVRLKIRPEFLNGMKVVNGGVMFSLVDYAFALAANSGSEDGVAVNCNIQFIKPGFEGDVLEANVEEVSRSRKLGIYTGQVRNQKKEIIACFQATAYFKKPKEKPNV
ncbi:MAG: hotdog fold thioesterase [Candidatus Omnitrophica bacterium]|nr:hotdog fold thioesterase [Candidatus Omnitrophota bacterium]